MNTKKRIGLVIILLLLQWMFLVGASQPVRRISIRIGGGLVDNKGLKLDRIIPIHIPVFITYDKPIGGCGGTAKKSFGVDLKASLHLFYDSDTGNNFVRLEEITYDIILRADKAPEIFQTDSKGQKGGPVDALQDER